MSSTISNLVLGLGDSSPLTSDLDNFVLFILLSETQLIGDSYYSAISKQEALEDFKFSPKAWDTAIENLKSKGYIQVSKDKGIKVAHSEKDGSVNYLCESSKESDTEDLEELKTEIRPLLNNYISLAKKRGKALDSDALVKNIKIVLDKEYSELTPTVIGRYFNALQEIVFQKEPRALAIKENAQLKNFVKLYKSVDAIKLVTYYILNSGDFHKTAPSPGSLLMVKDALFAKVFNIKSKEKLRHDKQTTEVGFA